MIKPLLSVLSFLAVCSLPGTALAQQGVVKTTTLAVTPAQTYQVAAQSSEAIGLKCEDCVIEQAYFVVGKDTVKINQDAHADMSSLVFLPSKQENITFYSGTIKGELYLTFINGAPKKAITKKTITFRTGNGDCEFEVVPTAVWRAGLAQPTYTPSFATTKVVAVHHGASANTAPTYEEGLRIVRSYYNYHRSIGWADIGYNYLIGPDGTIFQGREKLSWQTRDSDEIIGAHLCSKNTGAMGICLTGDYTGTMPTAKTLESLYKLIKWKVEKDNIDMTATVMHSTNTSPIPTVIGHRDGPCSTTCPGDALYNNLFKFPTNDKNLSDRKINIEVGNLCAAPLGLTNEDMNYIVVVYPNPSNGQELKTNFEYKTVAIHSLDGKVVRPTAKKAGESISTQGLTAGTYFLHFETPDYGKVVRRIVVN